MNCRIGQESKCNDSGCEWRKCFGDHCGNLKSNREQLYDMLSAHQDTKKGSVTLKPPVAKESVTSKKKLIYERSNGICYLCGEKVEMREMSVDHVIPRSRGGNNNIQNLRAVHSKCNGIKGSLLLEEINLPLNIKA